MRKLFRAVCCALLLLNGAVNASYVFDGTNDALTRTASVPVTTYPFTAAGWVKNTELAGATEALMCLGPAAGSDNYFGVRLSATVDTPVAFAFVSTGISATAAASITSDTTWYHITAVFTSATSRAVYIDGGNVGTSVTSRDPAGVDAIYFGYDCDAGDDFQGLLAHWAIWDIALDATAAANLASGDNPLAVEVADLVAYWPLTADPDDVVGAFDLTVVNQAAVNGDNPTVDDPPGPPTFDSAPALDACTATGCTFDYDADATADEIHAMFTDTAASAPTCAQIEAETGSHGAAGEASTGAADTITITSADTPEFPIYDAHFCLEEGVSNYSGVVTVADVTLSAPTDFQFIALTSAGSGSPCEDFNTAVDPDIVSGDYLLSPDAVSPGDFALTISVACQFSYSGNGQFQWAENIFVYDASAGGWHASDIDFWANNTAPSCDEYPGFAILDEDQAITQISLSASCDDVDTGDDMTFAVTSGTPPNGLSLDADTGAITGTPDTEDETGVTVTYTVTDRPGETDTIDITYFVVDTWTMPDCTGDTVAACITAVDTAAPWYDGASLSTSGQCSEVVAVNDIISQTPTESTEVDDPLETISVVVSTGTCWDLTGIPLGWSSVSNALADKEFVALMRQEADGDGVWAYWRPGAVHATSNLRLDLMNIRDEANTNAAWARWAPGAPRNSANLQIDLQAALTADFVVTP